MGLTYELAYALPFGELLDLIAIEQIKNEGAKRKKTEAEEDAEFMRILSLT